MGVCIIKIHNVCIIVCAYSNYKFKDILAKNAMVGNCTFNHLPVHHCCSHKVSPDLFAPSVVSGGTDPEHI